LRQRPELRGQQALAGAPADGDQVVVAAQLRQLLADLRPVRAQTTAG